MPNEIEVRANGVAGALSVALGTGDTTMTSDGLADLPVIGTASHAMVTLAQRNANGRVTKIEVVQVTAHTAAATTATIVRAQEGTTAQAWTIGDSWAHGPTARDFQTVPIAASMPNSQALTTTLTDLAGLAVPLEASATYEVYNALVLSAVGGTGPTLITAFTGPASPDRVHLRRIHMTAATTGTFAVISSFTNFAAATIAANLPSTVEGIIRTGAASGILQARASMGGTAPTGTIPAHGGILRVTRVA